MPHLGNNRLKAQFPAPRHGPAAIAILGLILLAGCQRGASTDPATVAALQAPYPSLATVPPRPQPGLNAEQQQAIEDQLVRDREHAAYQEKVLDYETGRSSTPPPAPPKPAVAAAAPPASKPERPHGPGDSPAVEAYVKDALARDEDEGRLKDFLRKLERPVPGAQPPKSLAAAIGLTSEPATDSAGQAGRPQSTALQRFGNYLGGVLGVDTSEVQRQPSAEAALPTPEAPALATIAFAQGSASLPPGADASLGRALAEARAAGAGLRIAGGGADGAMPGERTRAVAQALQRLGATPAMLDLAPGGGDEVRVSLAPKPHA